ncbi:hypothetical protein T12_9357 [Trichinella patagoniensis]|uniref:Uncharacterized protein n=1 Tax=Trichinella patagoniensis TaxID=990121 RepID=A0A0V0ZEZ6_9BILA|nr:hypothetical protein T12_9357 [Trichinella patagoniensis]
MYCDHLKVILKVNISPVYSQQIIPSNCILFGNKSIAMQSNTKPHLEKRSECMFSEDKQMERYVTLELLCGKFGRIEKEDERNHEYEVLCRESTKSKRRTRSRVWRGKEKELAAIVK